MDKFGRTSKVSRGTSKSWRFPNRQEEKAKEIKKG